jgi:hypothetical protein
MRPSCGRKGELGDDGAPNCEKFVERYSSVTAAMTAIRERSLQQRPLRRPWRPAAFCFLNSTPAEH